MSMCDENGFLESALFSLANVTLLWSFRRKYVTRWCNLQYTMHYYSGIHDNFDVRVWTTGRFVLRRVTFV
jgi:hypothetical protein